MFQPWHVDPDTIKAAASLISSVAWPIVAVIFVYAFKPQLEGLVGRVTEVKAFGFQAKIEHELKSAGEDADKTGLLSTSPTKEELARAEKVEELATQADITFIKRQVDGLAAKYEHDRLSIERGDDRTIAMEAVVSQMRAIGRAASYFRYELAASPSPGKRLQAIASLQVLPDYDLLQWLAERVSKERPFVAYHALVALNVAARAKYASDNVAYLKLSLQEVQKATTALKPNEDRKMLVTELGQRIADLESSA